MLLGLQILEILHENLTIKKTPRKNGPAREDLGVVDSFVLSNESPDPLRQEFFDIKDFLENPLPTPLFWDTLPFPATKEEKFVRIPVWLGKAPLEVRLNYDGDDTMVVIVGGTGSDSEAVCVLYGANSHDREFFNNLGLIRR